MNDENDVKNPTRKMKMTEQEFHKYVLSECEQQWNEHQKDTYGLWEYQSDDTKAEYYNNMYKCLKFNFIGLGGRHMNDKRMIELLNNFIDYLTECNDDIEDTITILRENIGMRREEWEELGCNLTPDDVYDDEDEDNDEYEEIEFFEGDEGDLDAEEYVDEECLEPGSYEIEWDDYRKGYSLKVINKD